MMRRDKLAWSRSIFLLCAMTLATLAFGNQSPSENHLWHSALQKHYFGERPIDETTNIISLDAPKRAEDASVVPILLRARIPQTDERYIRKLTLLIDNNPDPMVGVFHLTPDVGLASMSMRVRVNTYSPIRAIAELSDGSLHMSRKFIKASGGCSAPAATDMELAMSRLGKIRLKTKDIHGANDLVQLKVSISHPNVTGLQMNQITRQLMPAHFVKQLRVKYAGEEILRADTAISISENPTFRFHLLPQAGGDVEVEVIDSEDSRFEQKIHIAPPEV